MGLCEYVSMRTFRSAIPYSHILIFSYSLSNVYDPANRGQCRFGDCFRQCRVRVHRFFHLLDCRFQVSADDELGDQLTRTRSDDMRADDLAVLFVANDLHEAFRLARCACATVRAPREYPDFDVETFLTRGGFRQTDRCDFRMTVRHARNVVVVHHAVADTTDVLDDRDALVTRFVCK